MGRTGDGRDQPAEQPSRFSAMKSRIRQHDIGKHRSKKKQRVSIRKTETESATVTLNHTSTSYTHSYANSYSYSYSRGKEKRHKGKAKRAIADDKRKWVYSTHDVSPNQDRVILMSYNILGVKNAAAHEDLYRNVSPKYLDWDYRKKLICKEIRDYNPDIMCFQEVDRFDDLDYLLQKEGFKGVYQARTGDASDGCAIFWNNKLFDILHEESIEFQNFNLRNNVCQLCVFKMNVKSSTKDVSASNSESVSSPSFLVGNIHVLYNPNRGDIKLGQVRLFLESAQRLSHEWGDIPVVLAGDLNSMPQSAMYQFLTSNKLDIQMHDRKQISGQIYPLQNRSFNPRLSYRWSNEELLLATGTGASQLIHQLQLRSAYAGAPGSSRTRENSGEPLATSYHSKFLGTVDYIWHTTEFVPVRVLDTLPVDILRRTGGLPSEKWGSDHLSLVCELAFADEGSET
ncbi:carbon catabolite repressor protein 4 homolog 5 isoform X2 [Solanum lycopersicum]|uniref:carbon catabolite repressor protein 4 homolog 5 isoform X2 n=1 Tax=Solanum lycopersicum TaxID=4081 RepID=UPI0002BCAD3F|nr:carbon catabolite repressor protein 4 homolog 5 isoform X2 [Solanum lycopersicum]